MEKTLISSPNLIKNKERIKLLKITDSVLLSKE